MQKRLPHMFLICLGMTLFAACAMADSTPSSATARAIGDDGGMITKITPALVKVDKSQFKLAKEISSPTWINSEKINWSDLRGKVIVVDFWTFACYNCKNTLPYKKAWYSKYAEKGLVILGVHTPELSFEKDVDNVRQAVKEYEIKYPVAIDGDFANWNRYSVYAWPTWFIVDKEGYIRYSHIGEGDYAGSERMIQQLLAE
jgi:thiol-disulfide isomerase/thioredoxin